MKTYMKIFLNKIKTSFINSTNGLESFAVVTWGWGAFFYFLSLAIFLPAYFRLWY